jgi:acyl carrier protein
MTTSTRDIEVIFSDKLLRHVASPDDDLLEAGILDSMNFIDLVLNLEERFGFTLNIMDLNIEQFRSIRSIAELVSTLHADTAAAVGRTQ